MIEHSEGGLRRAIQTLRIPFKKIRRRKVLAPTRQSLQELEPTEQYVGLLDVLGWGHYVKADFKNAVKIYDAILEPCDRLLRREFSSRVSIRIFSDSILLVSPDLSPILKLANTLHFTTLFQDCLLRGGIARGKHVESGSQGQLYIVSEALVRAAELEKKVKNPCVVLDSTAVPAIPFAQLKTISPFLRPYLFFDGLWIINPFNIGWGTSAAKRVTQLKEKYPDYVDKYDWFLRLYEAVRSGAPLVPV